jgi:hypothetical protein
MGALSLRLDFLFHATGQSSNSIQYERRVIRAERARRFPKRGLERMNLMHIRD